MPDMTNERDLLELSLSLLQLCPTIPSDLFNFWEVSDVLWYK